MKEKLLGILFIFVSFVAYSETEQFLMSGFEMNISRSSIEDDTDKIYTTINGSGINLIGFAFFDDKPTGLFAHLSFISPFEIYTELDSTGKITHIDKSDYERIYYISTIFGIGGNSSPFMNNKISVLTGFGIHLDFLFIEDTIYVSNSSYSMNQLTNDIGIGAEMSVKISFSNSFFGHFGVGIILDFLRATDLKIDGEKVPTESEGYFGFHLPMWLGFGIKI